MARGRDTCYRIKVLLVGDDAVAKSELIADYIKDADGVLSAPEFGSCHMELPQGRRAILHLVDSGRQVPTGLECQSDVDAVGVLFVYDLNRFNTLQMCKFQFEDYRNSLSDLPCMLVGHDPRFLQHCFNQLPRPTNHCVTSCEAANFAEQEGLSHMSAARLSPSRVFTNFVRDIDDWFRTRRTNRRANQTRKTGKPNMRGNQAQNFVNQRVPSDDAADLFQEGGQRRIREHAMTPSYGRAHRSAAEVDNPFKRNGQIIDGTYLVSPSSTRCPSRDTWPSERTISNGIENRQRKSGGRNFVKYHVPSGDDANCFHQGELQPSLEHAMAPSFGWAHGDAFEVDNPFKRSRQIIDEKYLASPASTRCPSRDSSSSERTVSSGFEKKKSKSDGNQKPIARSGLFMRCC